MKNKKCIIKPKTNERKEFYTPEFVTIILLSESHGYRMKSYGSIPLVKILDKTLIQKQIEVIKSFFSNYEIILCSGFDVKKTVEYVKENFPSENIRVVENQVHLNSNCCESTRLCLNNTTNHRVLICSGGILLTADMLSQINYKTDCVLVQDDNPMKNFEVSAMENDFNLQNLCLGEKINFWTECLYLSNDSSVKKMYDIISNPDFKNKFIFEAINDLSRTNRIKVVKNTLSPITKIDNIKTLKDISSNESINSRL